MMKVGLNQGAKLRIFSNKTMLNVIFYKMLFFTKNKLLSSYEERSCQNNFKTYLL